MIIAAALVEGVALFGVVVALMSNNQKSNAPLRLVRLCLINEKNGNW
jgi:hypothetical protein